jgi:hypothetical protein
VGRWACRRQGPACTLGMHVQAWACRGMHLRELIHGVDGDRESGQAVHDVRRHFRLSTYMRDFDMPSHVAIRFQSIMDRLTQAELAHDFWCRAPSAGHLPCRFAHVVSWRVALGERLGWLGAFAPFEFSSPPVPRQPGICSSRPTGQSLSG